MKKVFLVLLIGFLTLIPGVNAEVNSCSKTVNLFDEVWTIGKRYNYTVGSSLVIADSSLNAISSNFIEVESSTNYYFSNNYSIASGTVALLDSDFNLIKYIDITNNLSILTTDKTKYITFMIASYSMSSSFFDSRWAQFEKGSSKTDYISYELCSNEPEESDPVVPDSTLDTFYSIYLDKLGMLSNYAIENKFIFSSICIILLFIILEIILYLFKRGGYK